MKGNNTLRRFWICFLPVLTTALLSSDRAVGRPSDAGRTEIAQISVGSVNLSRIDTDSAEFQLQVIGTATKSVTVKSIFFQQLTVDDIPIRVPPIIGPLKLRSGEEITSLPVLTALLSFRELPSLSPLRRMVSQGSAHIHGVAIVQLDLNPLEMLLMRSLNAWAAVNIDQEMAITPPGGLLGRTAAFAALTAGEPVWVLGNEGLEWRRRQSAFRAQAEEALADSSVSIDCNYEIHGRHGETRQLHNQTLGLLLPSGRVLTAGEAVEPWAFENAMAEALSRHEITIDPASVEISVRVGGQSLSTHRAEVTLIRQHSKDKHMVSVQDKSSYRLRFRNDDDNAVVLQLNIPPSEEHPKKSALLAADRQLPNEWQPAAALTRDVNSSAAPSVWITEVRNENGRCVLKDPAGVTAAGSPVWIAGGVVCLLQDDGSGSAITKVLARFPLELF